MVPAGLGLADQRPQARLRVRPLAGAKPDLTGEDLDVELQLAVERRGHRRLLEGGRGLLEPALQDLDTGEQEPLAPADDGKVAARRHGGGQRLLRVGEGETRDHRVDAQQPEAPGPDRLWFRRGERQSLR